MAGEVERMGWVERSVQTLSTWRVKLPRKVAVRSEDGSSSRRMLYVYVGPLVLLMMSPMALMPSES